VRSTLPDHLQKTASSSPQQQSVGERGLRYGLRDGACQAVTQGSGEQYLSASALLLQASPFQLSVLSALPQLIRTGALLVSVKLLQWFPNRKALIFSGTVGQASSGFPSCFCRWCFRSGGLGSSFVVLPSIVRALNSPRRRGIV
jgi:hypothetical protein